MLELPSPGWLHRRQGCCDDPPTDPGQALRNCSQTIQGFKIAEFDLAPLAPCALGRAVLAHCVPRCSGLPAGTTGQVTSPAKTEAGGVLRSGGQPFLESLGIFFVYFFEVLFRHSGFAPSFSPSLSAPSVSVLSRAAFVPWGFAAPPGCSRRPVLSLARVHPGAFAAGPGG